MCTRICLCRGLLSAILVMVCTSYTHAQLERKTPLLFEFGLEATVRAGTVTQNYPLGSPWPGYSQPQGALHDEFGVADYVADGIRTWVDFWAWSEVGYFDPIEETNPVQSTHTVSANSECHVEVDYWPSVHVELNPRGRVSTVLENVGDDGTCEVGFDFWGTLGADWTGGSADLVWHTPSGDTGGVVVSGDGTNVYLWQSGNITTIPNTSFSYSFSCPRGTSVYLDLFSELTVDKGGTILPGGAAPFDDAGGVLATLTIQ